MGKLNKKLTEEEKVLFILSEIYRNEKNKEKKEKIKNIILKIEMGSDKPNK